MILAGLVALAAGVVAFQTVKVPWVHLRITDPGDDFQDAVVLALSLRGKAAFVGQIATALSVALIGFGAIWFFYGFQRGWTMRGFMNPIVMVFATIAGIGMTFLTGMLWFVWETAMVDHAKAAKVSTETMKALLDQEPAPLVEIERLTGLMRFGGMMVVGMLAACMAWYAYRQRES